MGITTDRVIEVILTALVAALGGGGVWAWAQNRRKANAEAEQIATDAALKAMLQSLEFLKARVAALDNENTMLREQIETEVGKREAEHKKEMDAAQQKLDYFSNQLLQTQSRMMEMEREFGNCKDTLEKRTIELEHTAARLEDYLRRFPQFGAEFKREGRP